MLPVYMYMAFFKRLIAFYIYQQREEKEMKQNEKGYFCISISVFYCKQNMYESFSLHAHTFLKNLATKKKHTYLFIQIQWQICRFVDRT